MLQKVADTVRVLSAEAIEKAGSGHPGMPMGSAEIGAVLFGEVMKYNPLCPRWVDRDRLVLSAGHGSIWLYVLLHLAGYNVSLEDLKEYRVFDSRTPGHPELGKTPGVEMTTGPLGQGLAHAVGMALAERMLAERFNGPGHKLIDHYTYVVAGDGDLMEGISYEASSLAGNLGLGKLIVIYDHNQISIDGSTEITFTDDIEQRFVSAGWQVIGDVDGHDTDDLRAAVEEARSNGDKPSIIIASTIIGKGAPNKEGKSVAHGSPLGEEEIKLMKERLDYPQEPFYIADEVKEYFRERQRELDSEYEEWQANFAAWKEKYPEQYGKWQEYWHFSVPENVLELDIDFKKEKPTRNYSGEIYRAICQRIGYLVGGSADLTASTRIYLEDSSDLSKDNYLGRNIHFGVREHAMAAAAAGMVLHGGLRPVISTYLAFSDYMRPSIRLAAMMGLPVIYVFTHDSIYVGEDGPTHQPVEQLESLRMIPGLRVIRPADGEETLLAWKEILLEKEKPVALILSRQALPYLEKELHQEQFQKGGYPVHIVDGVADVIDTGAAVGVAGKEAAGVSNEVASGASAGVVADSVSDGLDEGAAEVVYEEGHVCILASGSEVSLAIKVARRLEEAGIGSRVISVPEKEKLYRDKEYLEKLIGGNCILKAAIEAGVKIGWYRLVGTDGLVFGVKHFGISGEGQKVARHFGLEEETITEAILNELKWRRRLS